MNPKNLVKSLVLGAAVLVATGAFASNKGSFHVQESVQINGQSIPAGDYQVRWEGTGDNVQLSFMQGKKEIAKTSAKLLELNQPAQYDSAVLDHSSGKASLSEVRFAGKKTALTLGNTDRASMSNSSTK